MAFYYFYCPVCGYVDVFGDGDCSYCGTTLLETNIESDMLEYFAEPEKFNRLVTEKYKITENPLYDPEKAKLREEEQERDSHNVTSLDPTLPRNNRVSCPYCKSTNVSRISTAGRLISVGLFGLGSRKIGKQWHCNGCKSNF